MLRGGRRAPKPQSAKHQRRMLACFCACLGLHDPILPLPPGAPWSAQLLVDCLRPFEHRQSHLPGDQSVWV